MPWPYRRAFGSLWPGRSAAMARGVERGATIDAPAPPTGAFTYAGNPSLIGAAGASAMRWPAGSVRCRLGGGGPLSHRTALARLNPRAAQAATHGCGRWDSPNSL